MSSRKPIVIYPEYFDLNFKRTGGRKLPLTQSVRSPRIEELSSILEKIGCDFSHSKKTFSGNWTNNLGSLKVNTDLGKTELLHKLGEGLKKLRKTD